MKFSLRLLPAAHFLLLLVGIQALLPWAARAQAPTVSSILNPDGTLRPGAKGSFNATGYQLSYGKGGQPVLQAAAGQSWNALGGSPAGTQNGTNGNVQVVAVSGTDVYVGGNFTTAGGTAANYVAKWNGSTWSSLGTGSANGVGSSVSALAVRGTNVYVGGSFSTAGGLPANAVAMWDGTTWNAMGTGVTTGNYPGNVLALALDPNGVNVYAGGSFVTAGGSTANNVAQWDGTTWSALGSGMGSSVYTLAVSGSTLYAGGYFTTAGGTPANRIAQWDGTAWSALGPASIVA
ncbi:hypothetical protein [Hymenobacter sp. BRD67]|uniref:hypothetical protein n=1 Tax=Hymenobacter sp. BRD67 TaxID=2675877 RepID=UPI0015651962|nr:hypothetical protein [Hymenobacter sp. BRD67]QKG53068.1 hypothetical protein GKZ67_11235 [Hymenobacter sp. BRD67]